MSIPRGTAPQLIRKPLRFERDYAQLPNAWLRDPRVSYRARGLLAHLMTHRVGFKVTLAELARESPSEGIDAIRVGVQELEKHGYLVREKHQGLYGRFEGTSWEIRDPHDPDLGADDQPVTALDNPTTVAHRVGSSNAVRVGSSNAYKKTIKKTKNLSNAGRLTTARARDSGRADSARTCSNGHRLIYRNYCEIGCPPEPSGP